MEWYENCLDRRMDFLNEDDIEKYESLIRRKNGINERIDELHIEIDRRTKNLIAEIDDLEKEKADIDSIFDELHNLKFQVRLGDLVSNIGEISEIDSSDINVKASIKNDGSRRSFYDIVISYGKDGQEAFNYVFNTVFLSENDWDRKQADGFSLRQHYLYNTNSLYGVVLFDKWEDLLCDVDIDDVEFFSNGNVGHPKGLFKDAVIKCLREKSKSKGKVKRIN